MFTHGSLAVVILVFALHGQGFAGRIIGGHEAKPHSRPYMALLTRHMPDGSTRYCGAFLLTEDLVMTAAHCQAKSYEVKLGLHNIYDVNADVQNIIVEQAFPHKDFNESTFVNDVMLLQLSSKAKLNQNVKPIEFADQDIGRLPTSCIVCGWGRHDNTGMMSLKLMEVSVTLIENENCAKENSYCSKGDAGPGEGDSGGPLVCECGLAYGVMSSMLNPDSGGPPVHRFAKITDVREWIASTTAKALRKI